MGVVVSVGPIRRNDGPRLSADTSTHAGAADEREGGSDETAVAHEHDGPIQPGVVGGDVSTTLGVPVFAHRTHERLRIPTRIRMIRFDEHPKGAPALGRRLPLDR